MSPKQRDIETVESPQLLRESLPARWKWSQLGEICKTTSGGTPSRKYDEYFKGNIPWVKSGELPDGYVNAIEEYITNDAVKNSSAKVFPKGTLLIALYGATVGKLGILNQDAATNQAVCAIFPAEDIYTKYLFWYLRFVRAGLVAQAIGGAQPNISQGILRTLPIPVAPFDQQELIVADIEKQFSRLDDVVANLKRVKANLKRYKAAVLKASIEGSLVETEAELARREGRSYETGSQLLKRILETRRSEMMAKYKKPVLPEVSTLGGLPKGWVWASVDQLAVVVRGASPRPAGDPRYFGGKIPWITVGPLTADEQPYLRSVPESLTEAGRENSRYIEAETLLFTNSGATLGVPKITLIGGCINDGVAALLDLDYPLKLYLLYFLRLQTKRLRGINQGAAQPNLNTTIIKAINVPVPPLAEQKRIVSEIERRFSLVREVETQVDMNLKRTERLRQSVLKAAFSGKLDQ